MNRIILLLSLFFPAAMNAQFTGGPGDGTDASMVIQLDLGGIPGGIRGLYAGGEADGFAVAGGFGSFGQVEATALYSGSSGDGYALGTGSSSLSGQSLTVLFAGGDGDGYSYQPATVSLDGFSGAAIYGGGTGDGFDHFASSLSLGGTTTQVLYGGGSGDGYDKATTNGSLGAMLMLYGGGAGDGYNDGGANETLNGTNLHLLYGGGAGDGIATTRFEGVVPLPLTLISFAAFPEETYVLLRWVTENESNTDFFTIEKTRDGRTFDWVGETLAAGNSLPEEQLHYELKDLQPYEGKSYYRLQTTDFDGQISLSQLVEVNYKGHQDWGFQLYPNPNTGRHFNVKTSGIAASSSLTMELFDISGRLILSESYLATEAHTESIELQQQLPAGTYLIRVTHPQKGQQAKILIVGESGR
ncbi:T9SS type A sorting domain-containing protein [Lewinella cohaerens]|uniref:T9SS type A sorting domain-containing protein n=1 Tax=Lewinella cohaerens TaxID=70995 RepID=UPI001469CEBB|nr:T9SS type A sorting domain-containing protein [Lewinella cohaerens]